MIVLSDNPLLTEENNLVWSFSSSKGGTPSSAVPVRGIPHNEFHDDTMIRYQSFEEGVEMIFIFDDNLSIDYQRDSDEDLTYDKYAEDIEGLGTQGDHAQSPEVSPFNFDDDGEKQLKNTIDRNEKCLIYMGDELLGFTRSESDVNIEYRSSEENDDPLPEGYFDMPTHSEMNQVARLMSLCVIYSTAREAEKGANYTTTLYQSEETLGKNRILVISQSTDSSVSYSSHHCLMTVEERTDKLELLSSSSNEASYDLSTQVHHTLGPIHDNGSMNTFHDHGTRGNQLIEHHAKRTSDINESDDVIISPHYEGFMHERAADRLYEMSIAGGDEAHFINISDHDDQVSYYCNDRIEDSAASNAKDIERAVEHEHITLIPQLHTDVEDMAYLSLDIASEQDDKRESNVEMSDERMRSITDEAPGNLKMDGSSEDMKIMDVDPNVKETVKAIDVPLHHAIQSQTSRFLKLFIQSKNAQLSDQSFSIENRPDDMMIAISDECTCVPERKDTSEDDDRNERAELSSSDIMDRDDMIDKNRKSMGDDILLRPLLKTWENQDRANDNSYHKPDTVTTDGKETVIPKENKLNEALLIGGTMYDAGPERKIRNDGCAPAYERLYALGKKKLRERISPKSLNIDVMTSCPEAKKVGSPRPMGEKGAKVTSSTSASSMSRIRGSNR
jgi:hypothetical protein